MRVALGALDAGVPNNVRAHARRAGFVAGQLLRLAFASWGLAAAPGLYRTERHRNRRTSGGDVVKLGVFTQRVFSAARTTAAPHCGLPHIM